jgi:hypothetical protein
MIEFRIIEDPHKSNCLSNRALYCKYFYPPELFNNGYEILRDKWSPAFFALPSDAVRYFINKREFL